MVGRLDREAAGHILSASRKLVMNSGLSSPSPFSAVGTPAGGMELSTCREHLPTAVTQPRNLTGMPEAGPLRDSASSHTQLENRWSTSHWAPSMTPNKAQAVLKEHMIPDGPHTSFFLVPVTVWSR